MPRPSDKTIEELLRTLARNRRAASGAAPELHPATRRLLHGEIARGRRARAGGWSTWWTGIVALWPRLRAGIAILAVLAVGSWAMWLRPGQEQMEMSKAAPKAEALSRKAMPALRKERAPGGEIASFLAAGAHTNLMAIDAAKIDQNQTVLSKASWALELGEDRPATGPVPSPVIASTDGIAYRLKSPGPASISSSRFEATDAFHNGRGGILPGGPAFAQTTAPPPLADSTSPPKNPASAALAAPLSLPTLARPAAAPTSTSALTMPDRRAFTERGVAGFVETATFVRVPASMRGPGNMRGLQPVLAEFAFERDGDRVRLRDKDGSVYAGQIVPENEFGGSGEGIVPAKETKNGTSRSRRQIAPAPMPSNQLRFRVAGTNRVLQQLVAFEGRLTGRAFSKSNPVDSEAQLAERMSFSRTTNALPRLLRGLHGTARVGTNWFEVEAEEAGSK